MKKCFTLFVILLCVSLLCSCGNASDTDSTVSQPQKTVTDTNSYDNLSSTTESASDESGGTDASAVESKTDSNSSTANVPSSENNEENSSAVISSTDATSDSSKTTDITIDADEYELPFIPK